MSIGRIIVVALILGPAAGLLASQQKDTPPELDPVQSNPKHHKFTAAQAKAVALNAIDGTVVADPVFKYEAGFWSYVVSVKTTKGIRRVWVDSDTGRIVGLDTTVQKGTSKAVQNLAKQLDKKKHPKKKKKSRKPPVVIIGG